MKAGKMPLIPAFVLILVSIKSFDCNQDSLKNGTRGNYFDVDLLRYTAEYQSGNVMISPASIRSILATILEGAEGTTASEIRTVLRLLPDKPQARNELKDYIQAISEVNQTGMILENSNALFMSKWLVLSNEYETRIECSFMTQVYLVDFGDPINGAATINRWVKDKTRGKIKSIIDQAHIGPSTKLVIVNALYFKSNWLHNFEKKLTHADCFYKNGKCKTVAMMDMQAELNYSYVENLRAHAVALPYQNPRYSMVLLMPRDHDGDMAVLRDLAYVGIKGVMDMMESANVILSLPKFTITYRQNIAVILKAMGIKTLFSSSADLSGIIEGRSPHVNNVFHSVYMSVDEQGTLVSAASASMVAPLIFRQVKLRVDRPFLFFILDTELRVVLFEGIVEEPTDYYAFDKDGSQTPGAGMPGTGISAGLPGGGFPKRSVKPTTKTTNKPTTKKPTTTTTLKPFTDVFQKIADWFGSIG